MAKPAAMSLRHRSTPAFAPCPSHPQARTSAVLREPTTALRGSGTVDRDPQAAAATATWAHSPGRSGLVSSSSTSGRHTSPSTTAYVRGTARTDHKTNPSRRRPSRGRIGDRDPQAAAAVATWAHSPGRSGLVSRHTQPRTSAVLCEPTTDNGRRTTRPAADLRESGTVDRDPQVAAARGGCRRVRGIFGEGRVAAMATWAHSPGRFGRVSSSSTNGRHATAPHNLVRRRYAANRPPRPRPKTTPSRRRPARKRIGDRDPQAAETRDDGGCRRVRGFFADGVNLGRTREWRRWRRGLTRLADPAWYRVFVHRPAVLVSILPMTEGVPD